MAGKKILVADDSLTIQKVIRLALSNDGYEIQAVSDGNDALQQISVFRPDIVLIDVALPGKSAFEVKREINSHADLLFVKFVLMSSAFEKVDEAQVEEVEFHGRLTKPFDPANLRKVLVDSVGVSPASPPPPIPSEDPFKDEPSLGLTAHSRASPIFDESPIEPPFAEPFSEDFGEPLTPPPLPSIPLSTFDDQAGSNPGRDYNDQAGFKPDGEFNESTAPPMIPAPEDSLWAPSSEPSIPLPSTLAPLPPSSSQEKPKPAASRNPGKTPRDPMDESDIRDLTESTIKMSGLDDFEWSIKEPVLKPLPNMMDSGTSSLKLDTDTDEEDEPSPSLKAPRRPAPQAQAPSTNPYGLPSFEPLEEEGERPLPTPSRVPTPASTSIPMPNHDAMERMIRKQVEETLQKLASEILPEMAEKVLKAEIHKLLNEQP